MAELPKIYVDACPFIDLAKVNAGMSMLHDNAATDKERKTNTKYLQKLLESARKGEIQVYTSFLCVVECTALESGKPSPNNDTKRFYSELFLSGGESGVLCIQPTQTIITEARDLRWGRNMNLAGMDAIHVASALRLKCSEFITTDGKLWKVTRRADLPSMRVIKASDTRHLDSKYLQEEMDPILIESRPPPASIMLGSHTPLPTGNPRKKRVRALQMTNNNPDEAEKTQPNS